MLFWLIPSSQAKAAPKKDDKKGKAAAKSSGGKAKKKVRAISAIGAIVDIAMYWVL